MNTSFISIILLATAIAFSGCSAIHSNPSTYESRPVTANTQKKKVTFDEGMVFYDASPPTKGLRFPPDTYWLEAEDKDYWYFRSPKPLELRTFKDGSMNDGEDIPGGIMIAKGFNTIPGAAYIDSDNSNKIMIWKLGSEFLNEEGTYWRRNF